MLHNFELDPKIIHHIIFSQAGSVAKAIIELIMNSIDAGATRVSVTLTETGFECADDGHGFASLDDVKRYFGRFGTPHAEGDATYGRFRLGRGQIMAHASTQWASNLWRMNVDTPRWGYQYDLSEETDAVAGCAIQGQWYEALSAVELLSTVQEIRDLIRYTTIQVFLNGAQLNKNPANEAWDFEDENAYYRVKTDGAVFIYNQGVLVRPDSSHIWGVGGLIVTKKAIDLNVSRTDILRKTCTVWKAVAANFKKLAEKHNARLGERRKTEARREKAARDLLSGAVDDSELGRLWWAEETITLLPGKKHISLNDLTTRCRWHDNKATVVQAGRDIPKGEAIAHTGQTVVIHPDTLSRFGCHSVTDFKEALARAGKHQGRLERHEGRETLLTGIQFMDFDVIKKSFKEHTKALVLKSLDADSRRLWTALAWCLRHYAALCMGGERARNNHTWAERHMRIIIGESSHAEAWTDSRTYIAINKKIIDRLKTAPLKTASYIFSLIEHEVAHEGDSVDAGHDEAFFQRFHDISLNNSENRQRYMHLFIRKYMTSIEKQGKKQRGEAWREQYMISRAGSGREKAGLPNAFVDNDIKNADISESESDHENIAFLEDLNNSFKSAENHIEPDWKSVFEAAVKSQVTRDSQLHERRKTDLAEEIAAYEAGKQQLAERIKGFNLPHPVNPELAEEFNQHLDYFMAYASDQEIINALTIPGYINSRLCCDEYYDDEPYDDAWDAHFEETEAERAQEEIERENQKIDPKYKDYVDDELQHLIRDGETQWSLQRNAAASGFWCIDDYLMWRESNK